MQLIQLGEDKAKGDLNLMESKYKKKLEKLSIKVKALEEENNAQKLKQLEKPGQRQYRLDLEKSQNKVKKLEEKLKKLQAQPSSS